MYKLVKNIMLIVLVIFLICVILLLLLAMLFNHMHMVDDNSFQVGKCGTKWISEDESISFCVYQEMLVWPSESEDFSIDDGDYIAFGEILHNEETIPIFCEIYDELMFISKWDYYSLSCEDEKIVLHGNDTLAKVTFKSIDETKYIASINYANSDQNYFSEGKDICFVQTNNSANIDTNKYKLYISAVEFINSVQDHMSITLYSKDKFMSNYT